MATFSLGEVTGSERHFRLKRESLFREEYPPLRQGRLEEMVAAVLEAMFDLEETLLGTRKSFGGYGYPAKGSRYGLGDLYRG